MDPIPKLLKPFVYHGVDFFGESGQQREASCIFCGAQNRFYADTTSGQWKCMRCDRSGNVISFMTQLVEMHFKDTSHNAWMLLSKNRGMPVRAFKRRRVSFDGTHYLIPCFGVTGHVYNVRKHKLGTKLLTNTAGCKVQLYGLNRLKEVSPKAVVWICEGEWDAMAMDELLLHAGVKGHIVLAVPGADIFKTEWLRFLEGRTVRLLYDNDDAGQRGSYKAGRMLKMTATQISYLEWPKSYAAGFDIRDLFNELKKDHRLDEGIKLVHSWLKATHPLEREERPVKKESSSGEYDGPEGSGDRLVFETFPASKRMTVEQIYRVCEDCGYEMDETMRDGLLFSLAVVLSTMMPQDPVWGWLVSAPGGGKSAILSLFSDSDRCIYRSTLTPKTLCSGWGTAHGEDPGLFHSLTDRCLMCQDGTEMLTQNETARDEMMGALRHAFDGVYDRTYGNMVARHYKNLHFSMLIGITHVIYAYEQAALGERFLKLNMSPKNRKDIEIRRIRAAVRSSELDKSLEPAKEAIKMFIGRQVPSAWPIWSGEQLTRIISQCMLVSRLRAQLNRAFIPGIGGEELLVRPEPEWATRITKQLCKFGSAVAVCLGESVISNRTFNFVKRVARDTCKAFNGEIIDYMAEYNNWKSVRELSDDLNIPRSTLSRRLADLQVLGAINLESRKDKSDGHTRDFIRLSPDTLKLWKEAYVN